MCSNCNLHGLGSVGIDPTLISVSNGRSGKVGGCGVGYGKVLDFEGRRADQGAYHSIVPNMPLVTAIQWESEHKRTSRGGMIYTLQKCCLQLEFQLQLGQKVASYSFGFPASVRAHRFNHPLQKGVMSSDW